MRFVLWFKEKNKVISQNMKLRKSKLDLEVKYNELLENSNKVKGKYMAILEQKSDKYDMYLKYLDKCTSLTEEKKELKKQIAQLNEEILTLTKKLEKQTKCKITKVK